jgi:hypothetical protein
VINKLLRNIQKRRAFHRDRRDVLAAAQQLFPDNAVSAGPFKGLRYAGWSGHGSAVYAKLLGTYEAELHPFVEKIIAVTPKLVIDVGCAEGYYAVGLARRLAGAKVVAADSSERARQMCSEMACLNNVLDRVETMGVLDREGLLKFTEHPGGCLICDCEGGEKGLLDEEVLTKLSSWFLLVEMHEYLVPGIEDRLIGLAALTHDVEVIDSIDDFRREHKWSSSKTDGLPAKIKHALYREGRPALMRWLCASPRPARS